MKSKALLFFAPWIAALGACTSSAATPSGKTASIPPAEVSSYTEQGKASYYSDKLAGRATASGEPYSVSEMTAAHRTLPFGTLIEVKRTDGRSVVVRVNDRGPYARGRVVDLSRKAAEALGMVREGVVEVSIRVVGEAPGKKRR
jgi:rare lipoprotein A